MQNKFDIHKSKSNYIIHVKKISHYEAQNKVQIRVVVITHA